MGNLVNPNFFAHLTNMWLYGGSAILLLFLAFLLFDWAVKAYSFEEDIVKKGNVAVALVVSSYMLGVAIIVAAVLTTP